MSYINDFNQSLLIQNDNYLNSSYRPNKFQLDKEKCASFLYQQSFLVPIYMYPYTYIHHIISLSITHLEESQMAQT